MLSLPELMAIDCVLYLPKMS